MRFLTTTWTAIKENRFIHICLALIVVLYVFNIGFKVYVTQGTSMAPTYNNGGVTLVNTIFYDYNLPERWDVVVLYDYKNKDYLIKRVVALPYEVIEIKKGKIYINGKMVNDPIDIPFGADNFDLEPFELPAGCYLYIGDSRESSIWGIVLEDDIVGKVMN